MKDYKFLKVAKVAFKILSWVILAFSLIGGVTVLVTGSPVAMGAGAEVMPASRATGLVFIFMGGFYFLVLYSISEIIGLLLDIKGVETEQAQA